MSKEISEDMLVGIDKSKIVSEEVKQENVDISEESKENTQENDVKSNVPQKKNTKEELNKTKTLGDVYHIAEFMNLLHLLVKADKIKTEINVELNDKTRECFLHIIKNNPEFFSDFEKIFMLILSDNKIDINDIPHLTTLITKIYTIVHKAKEIKKKDEEKLSMSSTILKFMIQVLVKEKKVDIGSYEPEQFLCEIEELIDSCINLIELNDVLGQKSKNCGCFSIFRKK